jgi:hypothetical protein
MDAKQAPNSKVKSWQIFLKNREKLPENDLIKVWRSGQFCAQIGRSEYFPLEY